MSVRILTGDCIEQMATLPAESVQCCVTSPPYYGLRDYGVAGQIGLEATPEEYIAKMVAVFREVRRVLRGDGTLWLNIGDSYASSPPGNKTVGVSAKSTLHGVNGPSAAYRQTLAAGHATKRNTVVGDLKPKDLIGIPWMLAFALRADGWWLRSDIVWAKPNCMPESVEDRPTRSHEYVFLLTKSERYYYDAAAVRIAPAPASRARWAQNVEEQEGSHRANGGAKTNGTMKAVGGDKQRGHTRRHAGFNDRWDAMERAEQLADGANLRDVWWIPPEPCREAHFAVMPSALAALAVRAGTKEGQTVLDPFGGAGTTGLVAQRLGRDAVLCELNPEYVRLAEARIRGDAPLFAKVD